MKYILLLRGINVGGNRKVEMKRLRSILESLGCVDVVTYLNSGNVLFESILTKKNLQQEIPKELKKEFGFEIATLINANHEIKKIASVIPENWKNNAEQRTDVAYLFPDKDTVKILDELPFKNEFIDVRYIKGAIYWNVKRENVYSSQLKTPTVRSADAVNPASFFPNIG